MLQVLELPKAEPVNDHTERSVDHRYRKQGRKARAIASQQQLRRARENMRQRDGEDKGDQDSDVLEHGGRYPLIHFLLRMEIIGLHYFPRVIFWTSTSKRGWSRRSSRNGSPGRRIK